MNKAIAHSRIENQKFTPTVCCDCGAVATHIVRFYQIFSSGEKFINHLATCPACTKDMSSAGDLLDAKPLDSGRYINPVTAGQQQEMQPS